MPLTPLLNCSGNIMVPSAEGASGAPSTGQQHAAMTFIDFEYSDWAPRGHDWGNHFCECAPWLGAKGPLRAALSPFLLHHAVVVRR